MGHHHCETKLEEARCGRNMDVAREYKCPEREKERERESQRETSTHWCTTIARPRAERLATAET